MERQGNYIAVGAFIVLVMVMAAFWITWLTEDGKTYQRNVMYFEGSVMGLSVGSAVTYMGVNVGRVVDINVMPNMPGVVQVLADIEESTPIVPSTQATLMMRGVTGLVIIELTQGDGEGTGSSTFRYDMQGYREIPVKPSLISEFAQSVPQLIGQVSMVLDRISLLLNDQNLDRVGTTLANLETLTRSLNHNSEQFPAVLARLQSLMSELKDTSASFRSLADSLEPKTEQVYADLQSAVAHFEKLATSLDRLVERNTLPVDQFMAEGLPELRLLIQESRRSVAEIEALASSLKEDPSRLLYQEPAKGVALP